MPARRDEATKTIWLDSVDEISGTLIPPGWTLAIPVPDDMKTDDLAVRWRAVPQNAFEKALNKIGLGRGGVIRAKKGAVQ